jgi:hypothetical protein
MTVNALLLASGLLVAFYAIVSNRLTALLHPMRMDMAELGVFLLDCEDLPEHQKKRIGRSLDGAYNTWRAWLYAMLMPIAFALALRDTITKREESTFSDVPRDLQADLRHFCLLSFFSTIGNSPLATSIVGLQLILFLFLWAPIGQVVRELLKTTYSIEEASAHLSENLPHFRHAA